MAEIVSNALSHHEMGMFINLIKWIYDKRRKAFMDILKKNKVSKEDGIMNIQEKLF